MKPEKARGVEDVILRAAQMGQIVEKVRRIQTFFHVIVCKSYIASGFYSNVPDFKPSVYACKSY